jgi:oxalate decarboxylase
VPEDALDSFPKSEVYFVHGDPLPEQPAPPHMGDLVSPPETHRYRLLEQEPHSVHRGEREWRVDLGQIPIASTITGIVLELEPGGLRELHWHPNADEWQYVLSGPDPDRVQHRRVSGYRSVGVARQQTPATFWRHTSTSRRA